jgi:hypothetical protein
MLLSSALYLNSRLNLDTLFSCRDAITNIHELKSVMSNPAAPRMTKAQVNAVICVSLASIRIDNTAPAAATAMASTHNPKRYSLRMLSCLTASRIISLGCVMVESYPMVPNVQIGWPLAPFAK